MAAGTPAVVSDIPALREVGGPAAEYCAVGAADQWASTVTRLLAERADEGRAWRARVDQGQAWASRWRWPAAAARLTALYGEIAR
jgi:glycosyltransferase involved in cell wall biosynthesis